MASSDHENNNTFFHKCNILYSNLERMQFHIIIQVMRRRPTFLEYSQELKNCDKLEDFRSLLKKAIYNEIQLNNFNHILLHTGHDKIAEQIDGNLKDLCDLNQCDPKCEYKEAFSFGPQNPKDILEISKRDLSLSSNIDYYSMYESPRGLCILINNYFTIGTYKEMQRFRNIFYQLHFDVMMKKNLLNSDIESLLKDHSNNHDISRHSAFVFMIITSGNEKKQIIDSRNQPLDILKLTNILNDQNCSFLKGKPKLFFFNCCCEDSIQSTQSISATDTDSFPDSGDLFICHSSLEKCIDWENGTEFGRALADSLKVKASHKDINTIMIRTNSLMKRKFDNTYNSIRPIKWTTLSNKLYFYPEHPFKRQYFSKKTLQAFVSDTKNGLDHKISIELIGQLCKRLEHMHDEGTVHSDINPENIKISFKDGNEKIEVMIEDFESTKIQAKNNSNSVRSYGGNLCWRAPEVIKVLQNRSDFEGTKGNDIFALGCVIYFILSGGTHPFYNVDKDDYVSNILSGVHNLFALKNDQNRFYYDLIERMIRKDESKRPSIACVLNHPMFWTLDKVKNFFMAVSDQLQNKDKGNVNIEIPQDKIDKIKMDLKTKECDVFGTDWLPKLCPQVYHFEKARIEAIPKDRNRVQDSTSIIDLIKYIGDKARHFKELPIKLQTADECTDYLMQRFPFLLIHTYNAFEEVKSFKVVKNFYN